MTQANFAKKIGVTPTTVSSWERDAAFSLMTTARLLAHILGVQVSVITGENTKTDNLLPVTKTKLTHLYSYLDAGDKDILIIHTSGESMNRVFQEDALLAVKKTNNLSNGDIVVFSVYDEGFSCKQYYKNDTAKVVSFQPDSDDPKFEPFFIATKMMTT